MFVSLLKLWNEYGYFGIKSIQFVEMKFHVSIKSKWWRRNVRRRERTRRSAALRCDRMRRTEFGVEHDLRQSRITLPTSCMGPHNETFKLIIFFLDSVVLQTEFHSIPSLTHFTRNCVTHTHWRRSGFKVTFAQHRFACHQLLSTLYLEREREGEREGEGWRQL